MVKWGKGGSLKRCGRHCRYTAQSLFTKSKGLVITHTPRMGKQ